MHFQLNDMFHYLPRVISIHLFVTRLCKQTSVSICFVLGNYLPAFHSRICYSRAEGDTKASLLHSSLQANECLDMLCIRKHIIPNR